MHSTVLLYHMNIRALCALYAKTVQWCHNGHSGISNHQPQDCLLNGLFRGRTKKTSELHATGLCEGNSPVTGEFPAQRASIAEKVSIGWRHHDWHHFQEYSRHCTMSVEYPMSYTMLGCTIFGATYIRYLTIVHVSKRSPSAPNTTIIWHRMFDNWKINYKAVTVLTTWTSKDGGSIFKHPSIKDLHSQADITVFFMFKSFLSQWFGLQSQSCL